MLRNLLRELYWSVKHVAYGVFGTKFYETYWTNRPKPINLGNYDTWAQDPHRRYLAAQLEEIAPLSSILDVGCGAGAAVLLLAKRFPEANVLGIDVNTISIDAGNQNIDGHGVKNARLYAGSALDLSLFESKSVDVAFTDAVLLYIGPDKIFRVISEMQRVARKGLVFLEFHDPTLSGQQAIYGKHTEDGFVRDYARLLGEFEKISFVSVSKIPTEVFPTGTWPLYGYVIKAVLNS